MASVDPLPVSKTLRLPQTFPPITEGHLKLGGTNPAGHRIGFTSYYMTWDGQPIIPVMGEFHFSRYAHQYWEDELLKIKAGGVDMVATYVFWNHIEEDEGQFVWSDNNNLREFVTLCGKHGLHAIVRIGPFAHGECRNGGIPDWLYGRPFAVRSNDERYLAYVRRLYNQIARQIDGLLFKDNGPVIGIQLENEYMHAGAPWEVTYRPGTEFVPGGKDGSSHILRLKQLALDAGLDVPIYTCTGWIGSPIPEGEVLPMHGGYVFTPWIPDPDFQQPPTREFLFRDRHQHPVINGTPTYDPSRYPYACCEIGGGTQDTYAQRNPAPPESVEGLAFMNLAGGANLIGYYMVHGGTNPVGKHSFMNEHTVPRRSYDFQAPIREFGQIADSYRSLRLLHLFLNAFGDLLAPMQVSLPDDAPSITPDDTSSLRCAIRSKDGAGFLFLNSYQDHVEMRDLDNQRFQLCTLAETIHIPQTRTLTLKKNVSAILPFGLSLNGIRLCSATTQLLTRLEDGDVISYVFFAPRGMVSEYTLESSTYTSLAVVGGETVEIGGCVSITVTPGFESIITLKNQAGKTVRLLTLTREQAENTTKQTLWGKDRLIISKATVVIADDACWLYSRDTDIDLMLYPPLEGHLKLDDQAVPSIHAGLFTRCKIVLPPKAIALSVEQISPDKAIVHVPSDTLTAVENVYLRVDYAGDIGSCFIDGKLVNDNFCNGTIWELGLKQIVPAETEVELFLLITPTRQNSRQHRAILSSMAYVPGDSESGLAVIHAIQAVPEYKVRLDFASV